MAFSQTALGTTWPHGHIGENLPGVTFCSSVTGSDSVVMCPPAAGTRPVWSSSWGAGALTVSSPIARLRVVVDDLVAGCRFVSSAVQGQAPPFGLGYWSFTMARLVAYESRPELAPDDARGRRFQRASTMFRGGELGRKRRGETVEDPAQRRCGPALKIDRPTISPVASMIQSAFLDP